MVLESEELERPSEWLRRLSEDPGLYSRLIAEVGSVALAAYRIARARCRIQEVPCPVPTLREVRAAAQELAERCQAPLEVPGTSLLLLDCEYAGLLVIAPESRAA